MNKDPLQLVLCLRPTGPDDTCLSSDTGKGLISAIFNSYARELREVIAIIMRSWNRVLATSRERYFLRLWTDDLHATALGLNTHAGWLLNDGSFRVASNQQGGGLPTDLEQLGTFTVVAIYGRTLQHD